MDLDYKLAWFGVRVLFNIFFCRVRVLGLENLDGVEPPFIVASNHASFIDIGMILGYFPEPVSFVAKAELADVPLLGYIERQLKTVHLKRDGHDVKGVKEAVRLLTEERRCLAIFLEGHRARTLRQDLSKPKRGAARLAALADVPVVPLYIEGTGFGVPYGKLVPTYYPAAIHIGPPVELGLPPGGKASGQQLDDATEAIRQAILALQPPGCPGARGA